VGVTEVFNVLGEVTEEEDVILTDFTGNFNLLKSARSTEQEE
jgi:hypothetical protein